MSDEVKIPEGFTRFEGDKNPVLPDDTVGIICRDGERFTAKANQVAWFLPRLGCDVEVIAYKLEAP